MCYDTYGANSQLTSVALVSDDETVIIKRKEFHFSDVYRNVNYIGSRAKCMNPEGVGVHVNFASDPM